MRKKILLSKSQGDVTIEPWLRGLGFEVVPPGTRVDSWLHGVVIGGGSDPNKKDEKRDRLEHELVIMAVKERIPCLGICRGSEIVSLWGNGRLEPMSDQQAPSHRNTWHDVVVDYRTIKGVLKLWSNHHLKFVDPGKMRACAWSGDGLIEALIKEDDRVLGVLWHPEKSDDDGISSVVPWLEWVHSR
jgi:gamma-glutamyl-gamma-aminobutyrate hydrolase PuuD